MRQGFDRGVVVGIVVLGAMMVAIATTSYLNTRKLRGFDDRATRSREVLDAIGTVRADTRTVQAAQRAYLLAGLPDWLAPYRRAVAELYADSARLTELTAADPEQGARAAAAGREIRDGVVALDGVVARRPEGVQAIVEMSHARGPRSFVDPVLDTLAEMDRAERGRLAARERAAADAYTEAVLYAVAGALLGLVALGLFVWLLRRGARAQARAAARLGEQRELLDATLTSIGDGVIATDTAARVTFLNPVAEALTGWPTAEAAGRPLDEVFRVVGEDTRKPVENPARRALAGGPVAGPAGHTLLIARDGTERPVDDSAAPIRGPSGRVGGAVLVFRDITDRKRAQAALRESEERTRLLADNLPAGFIYQIVQGADDARRFSYVSGSVESVCGLTPAEVIADPARLYGLIAPEDAPRVRAAEAEAARTRGTFDCQFRMRAGGVERWLHCRSAPRGPVGPGALWDGVAIDVTERVRGELALKESEERYRRAAAAAARAAEANAKFRAFFEQGTSFAGVLTLDGAVVEANRLSLEAWGLSRAEVLGRPFWECGWWNGSAAPAEAVRAGARRAAGGETWRAEIAYAAGGGERTVDLILAPVTDDGGAVLFVAATGTDVTDRRRMEDALREADRRKDEFIALLAHELRNPLAPIRNALQVMHLAGGDPAALARTRAIMGRQLGHLVRLVDDLLDVSRINRNKMDLRRARVSLAEVIAGAVETARPPIDEAGHQLTVALPEAPVYLDADLTRLAQVFSNLLTNSAKYTPPAGRIGVAAERDGDAVRVCVSDTGIGIPAESLPHVFDMFWQVNRSLERAAGGLGIGLALVRGLVEMHGGTVTATSGGAGRGSAFTVTLPVAPEPTEPAAAPAEPAPPAAGVRRRVLVVDDNRDGAESMAEMLGLLDNEVRTAHDGLEAVAAAERFRPEVILMDIGMPRLNGLDATRRIRAEPWGSGMAIVALTGWGQDGDRERSRAAGCDGHLVKPIDLAALAALLERLPPRPG